jgi:hypothetical protein
MNQGVLSDSTNARAYWNHVPLNATDALTQISNLS